MITLLNVCVFKPVMENTFACHKNEWLTGISSSINHLNHSYIFSVCIHPNMRLSRIKIFSDNLLISANINLEASLIKIPDILICNPILTYNPPQGSKPLCYTLTIFCLLPRMLNCSRLLLNILGVSFKPSF